MPKTIIHLTDIAPLEKLRLRPQGAYLGTVTEPGALVSDGKLIFSAGSVPEAARPLADQVAATRAPDQGPVPQQRVAEAFEAIAGVARKRALVLGQVPRPPGLRVNGLDNVAVLRYGRGGSTRYVFTDAHRLLLLLEILRCDEVRCEGPQRPVLLCRKGKPAGALTALRIEPEVR